MKRFSLLILATFFIFPSLALAASAWPIASSGVEINGGSVAEPSGLVVYDEQLWVVSDDGYLWSMELDGSNQTSYSIGYDLEGITVKDGYLYLGVENPDSIYEFDPSAGALTGDSWDLTADMASSSDNLGLESLTYAEPYFYAGLQEDGHTFVFDLSSSAAALVAELDSPVGYTDISGAHYMDGVFYVVYDGYNRISLMEVDDLNAPTEFIVLTDGSGTDLRYELEGDNQEGVAFDGDTIYIAEDDGEIYYYEGFPTVDNRLTEEEEAAPEEAEEPPTPDYTYADSYSIDYASGVVTVTYQSGDTLEITFRTDRRIAVYITPDSLGVIVVNGRLVRVYVDGTEVARHWLPVLH